MTGGTPGQTGSVERTIRPARPDDLPAAAVIYARNDLEIDRRIHPLTRFGEEDEATKIAGALQNLHLLHGEDARQVWVAERAGSIVGFSTAAFRGRHAHIQYLFVSPEAQEGGIGRDLLEAICMAGRNAGCSVLTLQASDDPRALTRYFRFGLAPLAPNVIWSASEPRFPATGFDNRLASIPLHIEDDATLNTVDDIDKAVRGARRRQDLQRWLREGTSGALLIDRASAIPVGYYFVAKEPGSGRIGPVAAMDVARFGEVFANALEAGGAHHEPGQVWKIDAPGENRAAVGDLLAAGFRPVYATTFFASEPIGRFDRYLFHDLDFL